MKTQLLERFLRYVAISSQSDASVTTVPSTPGQLTLARLLAAQLAQMLDDLHGDATGVIAKAFEKGDPSITWPYKSKQQGVGWYPGVGENWSGYAPVRGGYWSNGAYAGAFILNYGTPTYTGNYNVGFRCTRP